MKYIFAILLLIHGLIHLLGYVKAFSLAEISQLSESISKNLGMLFLVTGVAFILAVVLYFFKSNLWFILAIVAIILSQYLIITYWQDAKFGTIANGIIVVGVIIAFASWEFKAAYQQDIASGLEKTSYSEEFITLKDIENLPLSVQKYMKYVGVVGKPQVTHMKLKLSGEMRGRDQDWFPFRSEQFNFFKNPTRLFFMEAKVKGLPTAGYHRYQDSIAAMCIKLLSLITVVDNRQPELFTAETVTYFNDLCLFAPSALSDNRISWEIISDTSVKATFTTNGTTISALLYFNEKGQLVNFVSEDRYDINAMKTYRFSTPVSHYKEFNGFMLPSYGVAIWHYPEGEFVYGKFNVESIQYNLKNFKEN